MAQVRTVTWDDVSFKMRQAGHAILQGAVEMVNGYLKDVIYELPNTESNFMCKEC